MKGLWWCYQLLWCCQELWSSRRLLCCQRPLCWRNRHRNHPWWPGGLYVHLQRCDGSYRVNRRCCGCERQYQSSTTDTIILVCTNKVKQSYRMALPGTCMRSAAQNMRYDLRRAGQPNGLASGIGLVHCAASCNAVPYQQKKDGENVNPHDSRSASTKGALPRSVRKLGC